MVLAALRSGFGAGWLATLRCPLLAVPRVLFLCRFRTGNSIKAMLYAPFAAGIGLLTAHRGCRAAH